MQPTKKGLRQACLHPAQTHRVVGRKDRKGMATTGSGLHAPAGWRKVTTCSELWDEGCWLALLWGLSKTSTVKCAHLHPSLSLKHSRMCVLAVAAKALTSRWPGEWASHCLLQGALEQRCHPNKEKNDSDQNTVQMHFGGPWILCRVERSASKQWLISVEPNKVQSSKFPEFFIFWNICTYIIRYLGNRAQDQTGNSFMFHTHLIYTA